MMHKDGVICEEYFETFCIKHKLKIKRLGRPVDYNINNKLVEVKGCKLFKSNGEKYCQGRIEFHSQKQLTTIRNLNCWICIILHHNNDCIVLGFIKSNHYPNKRKMSYYELLKQGNVLSVKQFLKYIKNS